MTSLAFYDEAQDWDGNRGKKSTYEFQIKGNSAETWLVIENLTSDLRIEGTSTSVIKIETDNYKGLPEKAPLLERENSRV